ncbi:MAG: ComEC/Rec2 family competence protein [Bacteroidota bacterium]
MRIFDFVSVKLTVLLIFGIVLGFYLEPPLLPIFLFLALSLGLMGLAWKSQRFFEWPSASSMICIGILITLIATGKALPNHYSHFDTEKTNVWQVKIVDALKPNPYQERYVAQVNSYEKKPCTGKLILNIRKDSLSTPFQIDDEIILLSQLRDIQPPLNPHQFDYKEYLRKQGICNQITISPKDIVQRKKTTASLYGIAMLTRENIIQNLSKEKFGKAEFGVIQALLLGKRDSISEDTYTHYKNAGAVHILAVSGLHVGVLLLIFQFLLKPLTYLPKGETIRLVAVVLLLWGYAFLAGLSPSVVRAVTMFSFVAYAQSLKRPTNSFNIIALSMFFILLIKPLYLFQVGFQMSYAAVFFIVWLYPQLQRFWYPDSYLIQKTWQLLSVSLAAQLGVLPISLYYFHQFPALFFVSNLLIIPFLGIILGAGILTMVLSLANLLPEVLVIGYNFIIKTMNAIIAWVASQESFVLKEIPMDGIQMLFFYIIIMSSVLFLSRPKFKTVVVLSCGIVGLQLFNITKELKTKNHNAFLIPHSSKTSALLYKNGKKLISYTLDSTAITSMASNIKIKDQLDRVHYQSLGNTFQVEKKKIYRVDSFAIFPPKQNVDILWISQSPKINLERWLDSLQPKKVVVDGTNFKSYITRWKKTCMDKKLPFHDTREKGAYFFDVH